MRRAYATVVGYRRPIRVNIRRKKPSNHNPSVDPCKDCKRLPAWYRVEEVVKYEWKNRTTKQSGVNPCICWSGSLDESDCQRKEYEFGKNFFVDTRITKCRNGMKVEFIRNGDDVRDAVQEEEQILLAEQMRMDEIRKEEREKKNLQRLKGILRKWEEDFNFPSSEQIPLSPGELRIQSNQSLPKSMYRGIPQIYVIKFPRKRQYYVGQTAKGYPKRVTEHLNGEKSKITEDLEFREGGYGANLLDEIMEMVQPFDMKCGWCEDHANVLEFWMQERLMESNLSHHNKGRNTGLLHGATCRKCDEFAKKYNIPWKSRM